MPEDDTIQFADDSRKARSVVAVTGATGFVGRHVVARLLRDGHRVRALVRDTGKAQAVLPIHEEGLELVTGDILDGRTPAELIRTADSVVNLIGIIREAPGGQTFERMHVGAVRALVDACRDAGLSRFVQMSALGVDDEAPTEYWRTKFAGERVLAASGLAWTIFRPSMIHGPEGELIGQIAAWAKGRRAPYVFLPHFIRFQRTDEGEYRFFDQKINPVYVADVARAVSAALERPISVGEIYNLVGGGDIEFPEILRHARVKVQHGKRSMPVVGIPGQLAAWQARAAGALGLGWMLPFDEGMAVMGMTDSVAYDEKARIHLRHKPEPFKRVFDTYAHTL